LEIEQLADPRSFTRGLAYERDGHVQIESHESDHVRAIVRGSMPYLVEMRRKDDTISWSCTCPMGEDGDFCKHCVAVGLAVAVEAAESKPSRKELRRDEPDLRTYLCGLDVDELADLLLEQAGADWRLRERLAARAVAAAGGSLDVSEWKKRIDAAFGNRRHYVPYAEAGAWAQDVFEVIDAMTDLLDAGHAAQVASLVEHAHRRADAAIQYVDDSDGWLTDIGSRLGALHVRACAQARPEPVELARRLAELEMTSELDTFHRAAVTYSAILDREGLAAYRWIVEPKWRATRNHKDAYSNAVFRPREAMIGIAQASGDPDDLIAIRGGDLHTPDDYLEIASALATAGRQEEANDWAQRGLATFVDRHWQTPPLREFLASQLRASGDDAGAELLWWEAFVQQPSLSAYRKLLEESSRKDERREEAIGWLSNGLHAVAGGEHDEAMRRAATAGRLIEIMLYEGAADDAWAIASVHGCDERTWMNVARARESSHPLDAIPIYERAALANIETKKSGGYRAAVDLLARIRTLATKAEQPERFTEILAAITADHRRKTSLMALIAKKRWV
jgi:uncharacterized Zn finger protein